MTDTRIGQGTSHSLCVHGRATLSIHSNWLRWFCGRPAIFQDMRTTSNKQLLCTDSFVPRPISMFFPWTLHFSFQFTLLIPTKYIGWDWG